MQMQIRTIQKGFEVFESKFDPLKRDSMHSNTNSNHSKGIGTIRMQILTIRMGLVAFEPNSKHSNANSNANLNPSNEIRSIRIQIQTIRKWIQRILIQIWTIQKGFEAFECKF